MPKLLQKTLDAIALVQNGADEKTALQITNNKLDISERAIYKLKDKIKKYSLTHPKIIKSANNQIKRILNGEVREVERTAVTKTGDIVKYQEVIAPSDSNILAAASMVYDRFEPVKGSDQEQGAGNTYIDLSQYQVQVNVTEPQKQVSCHDLSDNNIDKNRTLQPIDIIECDNKC
jgi:hypothetical protein